MIEPTHTRDGASSKLRTLFSSAESRRLFVETLRAVLRRFERTRGESNRRDGEQHESLLEWGRRFLPAHFHRSPSRLQKWLGEELDRWGPVDKAPVRGHKLNIIGPRGAAKSTLGSLAFPLRAVVEQRAGGQPADHPRSRQADL